MASEEPPPVRHTTPDDNGSKIRLNSAPPNTAVNMTKPVCTSRPITTKQDGEESSEAAGTSIKQDQAIPVVKTEPNGGESQPGGIPSSSSDRRSLDDVNAHLKPEPGREASSSPHLEKKPIDINLDNIQKLADGGNLAKLEAGVEEAQEILNKLHLPLGDSKQLDFLATVDKLKQKSNKTRTVVAIVGETGAGKTSLINALLDKEKLLVTSGWRACTAVICEISYNESDDPHKAYRFEVEFVSPEAWEQDLRVLMDDLVEDRRLSSAKSDNNTEAGIAYAKIQAVYPDLADNELLKRTAAGLAKRESVAAVLGTTRRVDCRSASELSSAVQKYLDSKDKTTKLGLRKEENMAFWPLIKVVRIFCRADALSTGLVVVDLPGVADSNPARAAIARKYMTESTAVWVTAPIKRAADNKVAKDLMGKSSRLQMKLDGMYSNMTFICTMADQLDFSECMDSFDGDGQIQATYARGDELQSMISEKTDALHRSEAQIQDSNIGYKELAREGRAWRQLRKKLEAGQQVYPPHVPSKRKRPTEPQKPRPNRNVIDDDSEEDEAPEGTPLTAGDISDKISDLRKKIHDRVSEMEKMERHHSELENELAGLKQGKDDAAVEADWLCVQRRNDTVKQAIRDDFAAGIKEIDEDEAQDDGDYDPSVEKRDYEEVARSLPIFTISSKAFQQLSHPKRRETQVAGFRTLLDTEIPQLVEHAKKLPEQGRIAARRAFLHEFRRLLGSLTLWCTAGDFKGGINHMSAEDQTYEIKHLRTAMQNLKDNLDTAVMAQRKELLNIVHKEIQVKSNAAIKYASKAIGGLVEKWAAKEEDGGRGIRASTYLACCRRFGERTKNARSFDFNEAILEPYLQKIVNGWEQAFSSSIPASLDKFMVTFCEVLKEFQNMMAARPELQKCRKSSMRMFSEQLETSRSVIGDIIAEIKDVMQRQQRTANDQFKLEIKEEMMGAYRRCNEEKGPGCFFRVKSIMFQHVTHTQNGTMYRRASKRVVKELNKSFESTRKEMIEAVHNIVEDLQKDFEMMLSNVETLEASEVARDHIRGVLEGVDARFGSILGHGTRNGEPAQPREDKPQQFPDTDMVDIGQGAAHGATESGPVGEAGAMDTAP